MLVAGALPTREQSKRRWNSRVVRDELARIPVHASLRTPLRCVSEVVPGDPGETSAASGKRIDQSYSIIRQLFGAAKFEVAATSGGSE